MSTQQRFEISSLNKECVIRRKKKITVRPEIEKLREEGDKEYDIREDLPELKDKTKRVHVGWLFDIKGLQALKNLLQPLDSTPDSHSFRGWKDLAYHLELEPLTIGCIQHRTFGGESESYYTLLVVAQYPERTLKHVLEALEAIERFDAIDNSWESIERLASYAMEKGATRNATDIIKPPVILSLPLVLKPDKQQNIEDTAPENEVIPARRIQQLIQQKLVACIDPPRINTTLVASAPSPPVKENVKKKKLDCTVMLTFASDGEKYIPDIVGSLRQERPNGQRIGVLILEEHSDKFERCPHQFISVLYHQVNYVMPVITNGYLTSVADTSMNSFGNDSDFVDTKWTRYIYNLLNDDYSANGCLNYKVRCIVPDELLYLTQLHRRMREPIFRSWRKLSSIDDYGNRLLDSVKRSK